MKTSTLIIFILSSIYNQAFALTGIPEPGMVFYGRVTNTGSNTAIAISSLTWSITEPGTGKIVQLSLGNGIEIVNQNSEQWFIARVPFQTTSVPGIAFDSLPTDTFALSATPVSYDRATVSVNGVAAIIKSPSTTTASLPEIGVTPTTHSKLERVDLELSLSYQTMYDAWISGYFPLNDPRAREDQDPDHDGISNLMERALGLNPNATSIVPISCGSITLSGQTYFTFTYRQPTNTPDAPLTPEITTNLQTWYSGPGSIIEVSNVPNGEARLITVRSTTPMASTPKSFIRLKTEAVRP
jgi:hypothetical protein